MSVKEHIGLDELSLDQEIWRFLPLWKAKDLFHTGELNLRQVSALRLDDPHESRLPAVLQETFSRLPFSQTVKDVMADFIHVCEDQTFGAKWTLDLAATFKLDRWKFTIGGDNVFNQYPDEVLFANSLGGQLPYASSASPFSFNGAFVYLKAGYSW